MMSKMDIHDPNVQYIATYDFTQTLLSDQSMPSDILNLLYDNYDLMIEPGMDASSYEEVPSGSRDQRKNMPGPRSGPRHAGERDFMRDYNGRKQELSEFEKRFALQKTIRTTPSRQVPWQLVAMAMQRSTDGKRRVVLTDDEGLEELLQYYGIQTMESDDFKHKLEDDHVIDNKGPHPEKPGFTQDKHDISLLLARRLDRQRREQSISLSDPGTSGDANTSGDETTGGSARGKRLGGIDLDD
jgi:hypothetical protein